MRNLPIVWVEWVDAHSYGGWAKESEYYADHGKAALLLTHSVGFLLARDERAITVLQSRSEDNDTAADSITIPAGCVRRVRRLRASRR